MVMYFSPHILQVRIEDSPLYDSEGQVIVKPEEEQWKIVGPCRCDDDGTKELKSENGDMYMSHFHIVYEGNSIKEGSFIRCMDGRQVRGEGIARSPKRCNYFKYMEVWI